MRQPIINIGARHGEKHSPVSGRAQFATIPRHLRHGSATPADPVHNAPAPRLPLPEMRSQALLCPAESQAVPMSALPLPGLGDPGRHFCLDQAAPAHLDAGHLTWSPSPHPEPPLPFHCAQSHGLRVLSGCPPVFISSATPRSTGYIGLPEFFPGPFARQAFRPPAVACCFSWQFPHSVFCAGH